MQFKKYSEIENIYRQKYINYMIEQSLNGGEFSISEKTHGSNLSFLYNGKEIQVAKRTSILNPGQKFFDWELMLDEYKETVYNIWELIFRKYNFNTEEIIIYGELFGGTYDHPDIKKDPIVMKIQKGIFYSPQNHFYPFDIKVNGRYIDVDTFNSICEQLNILYAKTLFRGTFEECLEYPNEFQTHIPNWLGLPPIKDNICEGIVIKPIYPKFFGNGQRVILKNKNEKWSEKANKGSENRRGPKIKIVVSEKIQNIFNEINNLITENRLQNVLSKFGSVTQKDFGKLSGLYIRDILLEYKKDNDDKINSLEKKDKKILNKMVGKESSTLIRSNFLNIIDGNF